MFTMPEVVMTYIANAHLGQGLIYDGDGNLVVYSGGFRVEKRYSRQDLDNMQNPQCDFDAVGTTQLRNSTNEQAMAKNEKKSIRKTLSSFLQRSKR